VSFWSKLGKGISAVGSVVAPFTGPLAPVIAGGTGFLGGTMQGGWKQGLKQGGLSAATSFIPGMGAGAGAGGAAAGTVAKTGLKAGLTQGLKSAATNPNLYASFLPQGSAGAPTSGGGGGSMYQPNQGYGGMGSFLPPAAGGMFGSGGIMSNTAAPKKVGAGQTPAAAAGAPAPAGGVNPNGPAATTGEPSGWWGKYGPLITQGGAAAAAWYGGKKAQEAALKRSPEEQAALGGAQGTAGQARGMASELYGEGRPYLQQAGNYYQTLLRGSRGAMQQAVAGPTAQLTDVYRGAERGLEHSGIRGAARDVAASDLNRERASKIAGLTTGVQPYAADALAKMGSDYLSQAGPLLGTAGNVYGNLLDAGQRNRVYSREEGGKAGAALGGLVRDIGQTVYDSTRKKTGAATPSAPAPAGVPSLPATVPGAPQLPGQSMPAPQIPTAAGMTAGIRPTTAAATAQPGGFLSPPKKNVYAGVLGGPQANRSPYSFTF